MRILVVGAGGVGGYFGARLLEAGADVTFLVRARRAEQLAAHGLALRSPKGDFHRDAPPIVQAGEMAGPYDLILLSCKAYDLTAAMDGIAPAVGADTAVLPLLNGMRHLETLDARFGAQHVLGGLCMISAGLDADGRILHLNDAHVLAYGERDGSRSSRVAAIEAAFAPAGFDGRASQTIILEMWEKFVFIAATAGLTCLMRAAVGDVVAAGGGGLSAALLAEGAGVAAHAGYPPREVWMQRFEGVLTAAESTISASMLRDIENGAPVEADHIFGDLLRRGGEDVATPLMRIVLTHLRAYEARRARLGTQS